ncbi:MAG: protein kinase [Luteolibacter sp.]
MEIPPHPPLAGLNPADLLAQGAAEDTIGNPYPFLPPSLEEMAAIFPQFEVLELIGKGGMGAVYKVRQIDLDRIAALKILPPAIGQSPAFSERFTREAKALAKLNHPGIVTLFEFGSTSSHHPSTPDHQLFYFLMEYVDGVNLGQLMQTGRISPREALAIVPQICDALQFAHDQGIVHRDIKPENILLDRLGRVKVADFGIAKVVAAVCDRPAEEEGNQRQSQTDATMAGNVMGTPQYMAPEQIEHPADVDHRADIYALGVVFYQMLTGELPGKELQAPSRKVHIDVRLDEIVLQAMEKNPELRFQQASVMKTRVEDLGSEPATPLLPVSARDAGFWKRFLAVFIDYNLVMIVLFPLMVVLAIISPRTVVVSVPFGLLTVERIIENNPLIRENANGSTTVVDHRIVETTVLGTWRYLYREETAKGAAQEDKSKHLIDPVSGNDIRAMTSEDLVVWILMIYWILMESSHYQASIGKMLVGIKVGDKEGKRISFACSAARNALKIISAVTLMIGFMMAGWTRRKQALHDILPDCFVTNSPKRMRQEHPVPKSRSTAKIIAICCGVFGLIGVFLIVALGMLFWFGSDAVMSSSVAKETSFGPVIERTINLSPDEHSFFSLGKENFVAMPTDFDPNQYEGTAGPDDDHTKLWKWLSEHDVDLFAQRHDGKPALVMSDMVAQPFDETDFDRLTPAQLDRNPAWRDALSKQMRPSVRMEWGGRGKATNAFQTRYDVTGLIQVVGVTNNPPGVKIRYKLLQTPAAKSERERLEPREERAPHGGADAQAGLTLAESFVELDLDAADAREAYLESDPARVAAEKKLDAFIAKNPEFPNEESRQVVARKQVALLAEVDELSTKYGTGSPQITELNRKMEELANLSEIGARQLEIEAAEKILSQDLPHDNRLEIRLVSPDDPGAKVMAIGMDVGHSEEIKVSPEVIVCDRHVMATGFLKDKDGDAGNLHITLNEVGAKRLAEATKSGHGTLRLAILIDGKIEIAPVINSQLGKQLQISERKDGREYMELLRSLPIWSAQKNSLEAASWLMEIDEGNDAESYATSSTALRERFSEKTWDTMLAHFRKPLGIVTSRSLKNYSEVKAGNGNPGAEYRLMLFHTHFSNKRDAVETVTFMKEVDGSWRAAGYYIR